MRRHALARTRWLTPEEATPAERIIWELDWQGGGNREFRHQILGKLPEPIATLAARRYQELWESAGPQAANLWLLDLADRLGATTIRLATDHDTLRGTAEACARQCQDFCRLFRTAGGALEHLSAYARKHGLKPPVPSPPVSVEGALARLCDPLWWLRALRTLHSRIFEALMRDFGEVHARAARYVSDPTLEQCQARKARTAAMLQTLIAENEAGDQLSLKQIAERSMSNPYVKRSELMVRIRGFEDCAGQLGHTGVFLTLTTPSRMHARLAVSGCVNPRLFAAECVTALYVVVVRIRMEDCHCVLESRMARVDVGPRAARAELQVRRLPRADRAAVR
jgi:hypothetical protein